MLKDFLIDAKTYQETKPFPHYYMDDALDEQFAKVLQNEILSLYKSFFDRYNNPFEQKYTLRDKFNYPPVLHELFSFLESTTFIDKLSDFVGYRLKKDPTRNFHGVHIYDKGDYLDIHVDAGLHPLTLQKKQVTLGLYLSCCWQENYGCDLEIWDGDDADQQDPKLKRCVLKIPPMFNRLVLFTCTDNSWHGNPEPCNGPDGAKRIFVTISYLSDDREQFKNEKRKAYFLARPQDPPDEEKDALRLLRADATHYKDIYRHNVKV